MARFRNFDQTRNQETPRRPYVILNAAMTLDGKIATRTGDSRISSKSDLKELHKLRSSVDAITIGVGTQLKDNPRLTVRRVKGSSPIKIVVDSLARTPPNARIFSTTKVEKVILAVSKSAPSMRVNALERAGAKVLKCGVRKVDLKGLLQALYRMGIKHILLEGGGNLNWSMLESKLVDEIRVTIAPMIVGGKKAITLAEGAGVDYIHRSVGLSLIKLSHNGLEVKLRYKVKK
ncbi:MAG: 2,5-diamino-6-(ribosylamino)-4(3H)-pyrimidinone 5'-phosphate reductase [Nitrososphaerota archaeon]|nr:2,5-diamino-6-(ribosylamino)-4(3H)-pyrimidinone 5'-phosphate reductase [Nitrososphaerota archaeon]